MYARWVATAGSAAHRATQAACAAGRRWAGTATARCRASRRKKVAASAPKRPPTSMSMTTRRQRGARVSSGYVSRLLRRATLFAAHPAVCQLGGAAHQTASRARLWRHHGRALTHAKKTGHWQRPHCAVHRRQGHQCSCQAHGRSARPVLRHTLATARSSGSAREASTPVVAQAVRWSPSASKRLWQPQRRGASGNDSRRRRRRSTRNCALGMTTPRNREGPCRMGSGLCKQQSTGRGRQFSKMRLARALITGSDSMALPTLEDGRPAHPLEHGRQCDGRIVH